MANLYNLKEYQKYCILHDWETDEDIKIDLDGTKTLKDNANIFYKLYNKSKRSSEKLIELKQELEDEIGYCSQTLYTIEVAQDKEILNEIKEEIFSETTKDKKDFLDRIEKREIQGFTVFVGKNNKQNDFIISKLAKDNDMWFHSHNCAGSHVLLKLPNGEEPDDKLIYECAKLAKLNSQGANSSKIGIIYTRKKNLRKPPAANLGYVTYKNEQEIIID